MSPDKKKKHWLKRLRNKYNLIIRRDDTFEEKINFKLTPLNVFVVVGVTVILLIFLTTYIIAFTPLREYIPGYPDIKQKRKMRELTLKTDSIEKVLQQRDIYIQNIKNIIEGRITPDQNIEKPQSDQKYDTIELRKSREDSLLRAEFEQGQKYNLMMDNEPRSTNSIRNFLFFTPVKGVVTNNFNSAAGHYGIDLVTQKNESVKAVLDGTIVFSAWTLETGYVIGIQHQGNFVSFYKHNASLYKKVGDYVKAGEVISIVGESGEQSTGPHLHLELWYNGSPVNPRDYIIF
jgi:murein DD-endopeptidase MepM/ murein hydrolase activator NlpD